MIKPYRLSSTIKKIKNSSFAVQYFHLISSQLSLSVSGIFFWWVVAQVYSVDDLGTGAGLISAASLIVFLSSLGIAPTLIRFLPQNKNKREIITTLLGAALLLAVLFGLVFLTGVSFFSPGLSFLRAPLYSLFFLLSVVFMQIFNISDNIYIVFKSTHLVLLKSIIQNYLRIGLLFFAVYWKGWGIFSANYLAAAAAVIFSVIYFIKKNQHFNFGVRVNLSFLKELLPFSLVNFLNALSLNFPGMIFPVLILVLFSQREAGFFYIPWMIFTVYCSFITSFYRIFLMRSSYGEASRNLWKKVIKLSFLIAIAGFVLFVFWGDKVLLIFNKEFSQNSFLILKILFCSIFSFTVNQLYITLLNIDKKNLEVGIISMIILLSTAGFSFLFLPGMKSEGVALAWVISNFAGNGCIFGKFLLRKKETRLIG